MQLGRLGKAALVGSRLVGWDFERMAKIARNLPRFASHAVRYARSREEVDRFPLRAADLLPMLTDFEEQAGDAQGQYFHQDIWAARRIFQRRPPRHVDVGSRIDGFVAHLLSFMEVDVVDIRPLVSDVRGLHFIQADGTTLSTIPDGSVPSLSSLHAVEHFGLGRYGDPVKPSGWRLGMASLARVLAPGGRLYFSVPIGEERLRFNAHRIFAPQTVLNAFRGLRLVDFSVIDDNGRFRESVDPAAYATARDCCGLFELERPV